jgi:hypothetical protein
MFYIEMAKSHRLPQHVMSHSLLLYELCFFFVFSTWMTYLEGLGSTSTFMGTMYHDEDHEFLDCF